MSRVIVEVHVPLVPTPGLSDGEYQFPWIDGVEEWLADAEETRPFEVYDDGEELGDDYLFFITGESEDDLLGVASDAARLDFVPRGTYAVITEEGLDMGEGRRVDLPLT